MMFFAGIDLGTTTTKAVIIDANKNALGRFVRRSGTGLSVAAAEALEEAMAQAEVARESVRAIVATGLPTGTL